MTASLLLSPMGRIRRRDFWIGFAFVMAASMLTGAIPVIGQVLGLVILWPQIVIHVKRLHDIGWTGWLLLLPFTVSAACTALAIANGGSAIFTAAPQEVARLLVSPEMRKPVLFLEIALAVEAAFLIWVGSTRGDAEANKFGPVPTA